MSLPDHRNGSRCAAGNMRHWFTVRGTVGLRAPTCQRCGAENPRPLTTDERLDYEEFMRNVERAQREGMR